MTIFINEEQVQEILDVKSTVDILEESMKSCLLYTSDAADE